MTSHGGGSRLNTMVGIEPGTAHSPLATANGSFRPTLRSAANVLIRELVESGDINACGRGFGPIGAPAPGHTYTIVRGRNGLSLGQLRRLCRNVFCAHNRGHGTHLSRVNESEAWKCIPRVACASEALFHLALVDRTQAHP